MKKLTEAFSLAEVMVILIFMGIIVFWTAKSVLIENPKQFINKYDKISSLITQNIKYDKNNYLELSKTENYKETSDILKNILIRKMNVSECNYSDKAIIFMGMGKNSKKYCWAKKINNLNYEILQSMKKGDYVFYQFENDSVIAIQNDNTGLKIFIDVNGLKGPNEFGKDVFEYKY